MLRCFIALLFPILLGPSLAFATCEAILNTEFSRPPDDTDEGKITEAIAISVESLTAAYARGIFPWSVNDQGNGRWYSPSTRGVLDLTTSDIPRSDRKAIRRLIEAGKYEVRFDTDFLKVINECAMQMRMIEKEINGVKTLVRARRWISDQHIEHFTKLHEAGLAHSVEVWEGDQMIGGLYGVFVNGVFSGESMFHKANDVTKLAYSALVDRLQANGHFFIDTQQNVGLTQKWGGREISRDEFRQWLARARDAGKTF